MGYHRDFKRFAEREVYQIQDTLYEAIPCTYCGLPASDDEHVLPQTYVSRFTDLHGVLPEKLLIVPSCRECNVLAGRAVFQTIQEKRHYIHGKLQKRYRAVLEIPAWSESELSELSPALAQYVRLGLERKAIILNRLRWRTSSVPVSSAGLPLSRQGHLKSFANGNAVLPSTTRRYTRQSNTYKIKKRCERDGCIRLFYSDSARRRFCSSRCRVEVRDAQRARMMQKYLDNKNPRRGSNRLRG